MKSENGDVSRLTEWLQLTTAESVNAIAKRIGVPQRTLANHVNRGRLEASEIVAIARAYDYPPVLALADLGVITREELEEGTTKAALEEVPVPELLEVAMTRLAQAKEGIGRFAQSTTLANDAFWVRVLASDLTASIYGVRPTWGDLGVASVNDVPHQSCETLQIAEEGNEFEGPGKWVSNSLESEASETLPESSAPPHPAPADDGVVVTGRFPAAPPDEDDEDEPDWTAFAARTNPHHDQEIAERTGWREDLGEETQVPPEEE